MFKYFWDNWSKTQIRKVYKAAKIVINMSVLSKDEIHAGLLDFYKVIESQRDEYFSRNMGLEPLFLRNAMIDFLINNLQENSVIADMLSGELIVPLAILFLQKHSQMRKIGRVYAIDDNQMNCFGLAKRHIDYFGLGSFVTAVEINVNDPSLVDLLNEKRKGESINATTVIEGSRYALAYSFFDNLASISPLNLTVQDGYIPMSYTAQLGQRFSLEQGKVQGHVHAKDINYLKGTRKS